MIISRTPLRISLFGGGTDYPEWFTKNKCIIIGGSINKYSYIHARYLPNIFKFKFRLRYFKTEFVKNVNQINHGPYREIIKFFDLSKQNIEIIHTADLPALSGLGSSSSSTVSAINAISALKGTYLNKKNLSNLAIKIEREILKESVGCQDQILTSFGGFNAVIFKPNNDYSVNNLILAKNKFDELNNSSILIWSGQQRKAQNIEKKKLKNFEKKFFKNKFNKIQTISEIALDEFSKQKWNFKKIGKLMYDSWLEKKNLTKGVSNSTIDKICSIAMQNGAYGAKLLGAGNGGFIYILSSPKQKKIILKKLSNFKSVEFQFENSGSSIIYNKQLI